MPGAKSDELINTYNKVKPQIIIRLAEFDKCLREGSDYEIFTELVFCLLTPQSKARTCWMAVECLIEKDLLIGGDREEILNEINRVRFKNNKARYILEAREFFLKDGEINIKQDIKRFDNTSDLREWLVENVRGMGYKEASHFLRNIGRGEDLAILDRHILRSLQSLGIIEDIPRSISRKRYLETEERMRTFSNEIDIPMGHLDLLFWYIETGEIFK